LAFRFSDFVYGGRLHPYSIGAGHRRNFNTRHSRPTRRLNGEGKDYITMRTYNPVRNYVQALAEDARGLVTSTAEAAGNTIQEARSRLADTLSSAKDTCLQVEETALKGAYRADEAIRQHPYSTLGLALGLGALIGFFLARRD
jgi:ElaB/YqjD/DUF883 family membrane-anchored ribosome-binding protein